MLEGIGETFFLATMAAMLARAVLEQGRDEEALVLTETAERSAADDDIDAQIHWRCVRALILARRGAFDEAEALVRKALDLAVETEAPALRASTLADLATVLVHAQRPDEARHALVDAIAVYSAKGDLASLDRAERLLLTIQ
jgi:Flp pilus assembly protein TadD